LRLGLYLPPSVNPSIVASSIKAIKLAKKAVSPKKRNKI